MVSLRLNERQCGGIEDSAGVIKTAVVPLYGPRGKRVPVHGGCGVLVTLNASLFVLTARHVQASLDSHARGQFLAAIDGQFVPLNGRSYRTNPTDSTVDTFDAAVMEIEAGPEAEILGSLALGLSPSDVAITPPHGECSVFGYPHRKAEKTTGRTVTPMSYWWHGDAVDADHYAMLGLDAKLNVAMELNLSRVVTEDGDIRQSVAPKGVSGSGMWSLRDKAPPSLRGIFTDARDNLFVGTSIRAHLTLIAKYNSGTFNEWWQDPRPFL